jgi:major vault protein
MNREDASKQQLLYRIPPFHYIHVIDLNTNVSTIVIGPQTFLKQDNQKYETF